MFVYSFKILIYQFLCCFMCYSGYRGHWVCFVSIKRIVPGIRKLILAILASHESGLAFGLHSDNLNGTQF